MIQYKPDAFPKVCGCDRIYNEEEWMKLKLAFIGRGAFDENDAFDVDFDDYFLSLSRQEWRHCECTSTICVPIEEETP